jgi:hypothetical protein
MAVIAAAMLIAIFLIPWTTMSVVATILTVIVAEIWGTFSGLRLGLRC